MPQLTIKQAYVDILKREGAYDAWLENLKEQWDEDLQYDLEKRTSLYSLLHASLVWGDTPQGHTYWSKLASKYK